MSDRKIKVGLVGLGRMGYLHLQKLVQQPEIDLVGVFDRDRTKMKEAESLCGVKGASSEDELFFESDAVIISASTRAHYELAKKAIEQGVHVLIEKPICHSLNEAEQIIRLAQEKNILIQTGFLERYCWKKLFDLKPNWFGGATSLISTERCSAQPSREKGLDIVTDLMIHDIDFVLNHLGELPKFIHSEGVSLGWSPIDIAFVRLEFPSGAVAHLKAAWLQVESRRVTQCFTEKSKINFDLQSRKATYLSTGDAEQSFELTHLDPLSEQLKSFLKSVQTQRPCFVSGKDGLKALEMCDLIKEQILNRSIKDASISELQKRVSLKSWSPDGV